MKIAAASIKYCTVDHQYNTLTDRKIKLASDAEKETQSNRYHIIHDIVTSI